MYKTTISFQETDKSTALHLIQAAYKAGYDEIVITYDKQYLIDFKNNTYEDIVYVVEKTIDRLFGLHMASHKDNIITLKYDVIGALNDLDLVKGKVFSSFLSLAENIFIKSDDDKSILALSKEKHDYITKQIAFILRLINKSLGFTGDIAAPAYYHIFSSLDKITDLLKYLSNFISQEYSDEIYAITKEIYFVCKLFIDFFNDPTVEVMTQFSNLRRRIREEIFNVTKSYSNGLLGNLETILDILLDLFESVMITPLKE